MKAYTVTGAPLYLHTGELELTDAQARDRHQNLVPAEGKNRYRILAPVCFKAGETIGYDGNQAKKLKSLLRPANPPAKKGCTK